MKRTLLIATPAVALALVLSGCSSDSSDTSTPTTGSTAGVDADGTTSGGAATAQNVLARLASSSSTQQSAEIEMTVEGPQAITGSGVMAFGDPAMASFTMTADIEGESQEIQMRLVDNAMYFGMPMLQQVTGKQWIKISADGNDELSKSLKPLLDQMTESADFSSNLEYLKAGTTVKEVGQESVNGEPTTKFELTTNIDEAVAAAPEAQKQLVKKLQEQGIDTLTSYVWVNADDLPVKYQQTMTVGGTPMTTTMVYKSWGQPVTVEAPADSEVGDLSALLGGGSGA